MRELTVNEAAEKMGFNPRWVRELLTTGKLQGRHKGRKWLIPEAEIERYLSDHTGEAVRAVVAGPGLAFQWDGSVPT